MFLKNIFFGAEAQRTECLLCSSFSVTVNGKNIVRADKLILKQLMSSEFIVICQSISMY